MQFSNPNITQVNPYHPEVYFQSNANEVTIWGGVQVSNCLTMSSSMWGPTNAKMGPDDLGTVPVWISPISQLSLTIWDAILKYKTQSFWMRFSIHQITEMSPPVFDATLHA